MLPSTSPREALLACPPSPTWNLPSFTVWSPPLPPHALVLILLSLAKVQLLLILTLSPLMIWYSKLTALFLFLLAKAALAFLPDFFLCGTEATLSFSAGPVCLSFFAKACTILHALCYSQQHQQVCHFSSLLLLSDSRSVFITLSSPPSFLLPYFRNYKVHLKAKHFLRN